HAKDIPRPRIVEPALSQPPQKQSVPRGRHLYFWWDQHLDRHDRPMTGETPVLPDLPHARTPLQSIPPAAAVSWVHNAARAFLVKVARRSATLCRHHRPAAKSAAPHPQPRSPARSAPAPAPPAAISPAEPAAHPPKKSPLIPRPSGTLHH